MTKLNFVVHENFFGELESVHKWIYDKNLELSSFYFQIQQLQQVL